MILKFEFKIISNPIQNEFTKIIFIEMPKLINIEENENYRCSITELFY